METKPHEPGTSGSKTWWLILILSAIILAKGFYAFYLIGDRGQPTWDYRPVPDVPAESAYAVYPKSPYGQHVSGPRGE